MSAWLAVAALALAAQALAPASWADDAAAPARAVRLSSVDGQVQLSTGNQVLADGAVANTPLFEGTRVVTSDDGRAQQICTIRGILERLAGDPEVMDRVRKRARALLARANG